ncbi:Nodule Cysteine-Rich (NCR) secreted peptide [Medicago truncatula]|uniref:Nodule Cysteine-Rich (NCR) secreted peptide n=1 Tax=Medicago truncatula TaxID=3880 RepID=G7I794_MEDTR|nr:Nodule Cysteine-Rich (NCR) secreted peptide [Medicago truncatula]AFK41437.1 unknown [Medicago truncatula]
MAKIIKIVYVMIVFFFIFLSVTNSSAFSGCMNDSDCPDLFCLPPLDMKCHELVCKCR